MRTVCTEFFPLFFLTCTIVHGSSTVTAGLYEHSYNRYRFDLYNSVKLLTGNYILLTLYANPRSFVPLYCRVYLVPLLFASLSPSCLSYLHRPVLHDGLQHASPLQMHSLWEHAMLQGDNLPISSFCSLVLVSDLQCHILVNKSNRESMIKILTSTSLIACIILTVPISSIYQICPYCHTR